MNPHTTVREAPAVKGGTWAFIKSELKPKGPLLTPFNVISIPIMLMAAVILFVRFRDGLGAVTNLSQAFPWGIWKGFNVVTGVAFAGGAYIMTFAVYVMKAEKYKPIIRATVLNGFLSYAFYTGALVVELGQPWNLFNPIIGNDFGYNSVLFLVAWHFLLYIVSLFVEFSPAIAEWLKKWKLVRVLHLLTLGAVIFGFTLSTLHQAGLGALFLMARPKIHPLWYSEFIPLLFFVSSIFAGMSMVILEGTLSRRAFRSRIAEDAKRFDEIILGLGKGAAIAMFVYYFFKLLLFLHEGHWDHLDGAWGAWFLLEVVGLVLVPCCLFAFGVRHRSTGMIRVAAGLTLAGVLLNRLNISLIAFGWDAPAHYVPTWMEVVVAFAIIFAQIWVFRWVVLRMPVYDRPPAYAAA